MIRYLIDRMLFAGYETAKQAGILRIIRRYSRGNTAVQNGNVLDDAALRDLRKRGDAAAARLARAERRHEKRAAEERVPA